MIFKILIPARKSSKGLKNKNLKKINGQSLVEIAILNAIKSKITNKENIFLSSNSRKILNIGKKYNISLIKRPVEFSSSKSSANHVIKHFVNSFKTIKKFNLIYLQPSSPLKKTKFLKDAINLYIKEKKKTLISGYLEDNEKTFKSFVSKGKYFEPLLGEKYINKNRQEINRKIFVPNGAIYIFKANKKFKRIILTNIKAHILKKDDVIDINNVEDLNIAKKHFLN